MRIDAAVGGDVDVAPVHPADPVWRVDLRVRLDVHGLGQAHPAVHRDPVDRARMGLAAPVDEVEEPVVRGRRLQPRAADAAAHQALVGALELVVAVTLLAGSRPLPLGAGGDAVVLAARVPTVVDFDLDG